MWFALGLCGASVPCTDHRGSGEMSSLPKLLPNPQAQICHSYFRVVRGSYWHMQLDELTDQASFGQGLLPDLLLKYQSLA